MDFDPDDRFDAAVDLAGRSPGPLPLSLAWARPVAESTRPATPYRRSESRHHRVETYSAYPFYKAISRVL